jgi:hypothetical protein
MIPTIAPPVRTTEAGHPHPADSPSYLLIGNIADSFSYFSKRNRLAGGKPQIACFARSQRAPAAENW